MFHRCSRIAVSHFSDSPTLRRIYSTNSAGSAPTTNISRQLSPPSGLHAFSTSQQTAARNVPQPKPDCRKPQPIGLARSGQVSASSATPVLHSLPMAMPVRKRRPSIHQNPVAKAVKPVNTAYRNTDQSIIRLRPT